MKNIIFYICFLLTISHYIKFKSSNYVELGKEIIKPVVYAILYRFMLECIEDDTNNIYDKFYKKLLERNLYQHIFSATNDILINILKQKFIKEQRKHTFDASNFLQKLFSLTQDTINNKQIKIIENLYNNSCKQNNQDKKDICREICKEIFILFFDSCCKKSLKNDILSHKIISFLLDFQTTNYFKIKNIMQNKDQLFKMSYIFIHFDQNKELNDVFFDVDYFERFLVFIFIKIRDYNLNNVKITEFSVTLFNFNYKIFEEEFLKSFQESKEDFFKYLIYFVNNKKDITLSKINKDDLFYISGMHENIFLQTIEFYLKIYLPTFEDAIIENLKSLFLLVYKEVVEKVVDIICKNFIDPLILKCQKLEETKISIYKFN